MDESNEEKNNINSIDNNSKKNNYKKKKKKHKVLKFFIIIILIFVIIKLIKSGISYHKEKQFDEFVKQNILVNKNEEIELTEAELKEDSNGDGLTNEQKINMGLDILSNDTDGDGLSDYDEINIYKSDPTKYSTSGDVLSDGYKVSKGYDLNKYYSGTAGIKIADNIKLNVDDAKDIEAYYKEYTGNIPSRYNVAMTPFRIYSFKGQVELKIDNPEYYDVISYDNINKVDTKIDYTIKDDTLLCFEISNDNPILIVYKEDMLSKISNNINSNVNFNNNNNKDSKYIVIAMPIFNVFFDVPVCVFDINDIKFKNNNNTILEQKLNNRSEKNFSVKVSYIGSFGAKILDFVFGKLEKNLATLANAEDSSVMRYILSYKHLNSSNDLENYLFGKKTSDNVYDFENKYNNTKGNYYADSRFLVTTNAFNFANLRTNVSEGGVCLGFAHFTSNIYNDGNMNKKINDVYDLSSNEYDKIWNKELYSYKAKSELAKYADEISGNEDVLDSSTMDEPDAEIVKSLEYYWKTINSETRISKIRWAWNASGEKQTYISSDTVDNMIKQFIDGKILTLGLLSKSGSHAINAYKIVESEDDPDILYLKVYDNNFPADMWWNKDRSGKIKYDITITLKRCYKNTIFGGVKTYYLFDYNPLNNENYHYSSINGETDYILFFDENANTI